MSASLNLFAIQTWLRRITFIISGILFCFVVHRNSKNQRRYESNPNHKDQPTALVIWSTVTFLWSATGILIFISSTTTLCRYLYLLLVPAFIFPHIFLSFYQLARLQLTFSMDRRTASMAYPKYIFHALYTFGLLRSLYTVVVQFGFGNQMTVEMLPNSAGSMGCHFTAYTPLFVTLTMFGMLTYIVWDWCIVGLYVYKLVQLARSLNENDPTSGNALNELRKMLSKVLFLTVIAEIFAFLTFAVSFLPPAISLWNQSVGFSIDFTVIYLVLYLMMDHNEDDYVRVLRVLSKCGCARYLCCCFGDLESESQTAQSQSHADVVNAGNTEQPRPENGVAASQHDGDTFDLNDTASPWVPSLVEVTVSTSTAESHNRE